MPEEVPDSVVLIPTGALLYLFGELLHLRAQVASHESSIEEIVARQDEDCYRLARDIAYDRRRLTKLEAPPEPTPSQKDRGDILKALLAAHGGKMPEKEARQKMRLSKSQFSQLLASMPDSIGKKSYHMDKRRKILMLRQ